jgi:hypothetical protein
MADRCISWFWTNVQTQLTPFPAASAETWEFAGLF